MISIKSPEEIEIMKKGGSILASILTEAKKNIKPGITTREIDKFIEDEIIKKGATPSFKGFRNYKYASCISINEEVVHGLPGNRIIKEGDLVGLDAGVYLKEFHTDSAISFVVGESTNESNKLLSVTYESLMNGIKKIKPGIKIGDIQAEIQKTIESAGFSVVRDLTGHGIGKELQENPSIPNFGYKNTGFELKEGMTFCLEPMVAMGNYRVQIAKDGWTVETLDKSLACHFEHTIAVTKDGYLILSK